MAALAAAPLGFPDRIRRRNVQFSVDDIHNVPDHQPARMTLLGIDDNLKFFRFRLPVVLSRRAEDVVEPDQRQNVAPIS